MKTPEPRTVLVHLNVEVPPSDPRDAGQIANAVMAAIEVGSDDEELYHLTIVAPLAEEI